MANQLTEHTPGGLRLVLGDHLPLQAPLLIQIFPAYLCNFKCKYCIHFLPESKRGKISDVVFMEFDKYKQYINEIKAFGQKIKMLRFAGIGEPLLHKDIDKMIRYAKQMDVAESIDIVTNGVMLSKQMSDKLIDAGLDRLRISIQGTSSAKYKDICGSDIDMDQFLENINYFYKHKKNTSVYIKIIDCALEGEEDKGIFYTLFENKCDLIAVEHMTPTVTGIDYSEFSNKKEVMLNQNGEKLLSTSICPQPFYMMQINPDGAIVPCCSTSFPFVYQNLNGATLSEIWNSDVWNQFRNNMLDGVDCAGEVCSQCSLYSYGLFKEDLLDNYVERLKGVYK